MSNQNPRYEITRRDFLKVGAGGLTAAMLAACSTPAIQPAPAEGTAAAGVPAQIRTGGTLKVGYAQKTSFSHFMHLRHFAGSEAIYSKRFANAKLLTMNNDYTGFKPDLAEEWTFSDDGTKLTFHLRQGLTWHDGEPFTAEDVRVTFHMISLPLGAYIGGNYFAPFVPGFAEYVGGEADTIEGMHILDDHTIAFDLFEPFAPHMLFLAFNGVTIAPAHIVKDYMDRDKSEDLLQSDWATTAEHVGIGPFRVVEYVPDQFIVYEPFEDYYRGKPLLERLIYQPFQDRQTLVAALENKEINVGARLPVPEYRRLQEDADFLDFWVADSPAVRGANINNEQPYLTKEVRQALLYALDREAITQQIYGGIHPPTNTPIRVPGIPDSPNMTQYEYNPDKAKQLLEEAGWDPNQKIRWATGAVPSDPLIFDTINSYWADVGIQAEYQVYGQDRSGISSEPYDYDLIMSAFPMGYPSQVALHYDTRSCTTWCNRNQNERLFELFDASRYQMPDEEYQKVIWEMQEIMSEEAMFLWIAQVEDIWGMDKKVHNLKPVYSPYASTYNDWDLEQVYVEA